MILTKSNIFCKNTVQGTRFIGDSIESKKYMLYDSKQRKWIHFGDSRYEQYRDSSGLGIYTHLNHGDKSRRKRYFLRHSGLSSKKEAIKKELKKSKGKLNARILSHIYLW